LRSGWLKKALDALQTERHGGGGVFGRDDALVTLGVGKNMVQAIRHWTVATRMAQETIAPAGRVLEPTQLGSSVLGGPGVPGWDPYLEDEATVWLLHWQIAGPGSAALTWVYTFNLFRDYQFSRDRLTDAILSGPTARVPRAPSRDTIARDVDCLVRTYVPSPLTRAREDNLDCPLHSLGVIRETMDKAYRFTIGPRATMPPAVFYYALCGFWEWLSPQRPALHVRDVMYHEGSPGQVFKLDEDSVLAYLDMASEVTGGALRFEDTALVRQIIRDPEADLSGLDLLGAYYAR